MIETYNDITFIIKLLVTKKIFEEILGRDSRDNGKNSNTNIFQKGITTLEGGISLQNYIHQTRGNQIQVGIQVVKKNKEK